MKNYTSLFIILMTLVTIPGFAEPSLIIHSHRGPDTNPWKSHPTYKLDDLKGFDPSAHQHVPLSRFGGWKKPGSRKQATGFFRVDTTGERAWLIDPDGWPYYIIGMEQVWLQTRIHPYKTDIVNERFGGVDAWRQHALDELADYRFNMVKYWQGKEHHYLNLRRRLPYVVNLKFMSNFVKGKDITILDPSFGRSYFKSGVMPVFDPAFETFSKQRAIEETKLFRDDPHLIGYYTDNELGFHERFSVEVKLIESYLRLPEADPNRQEVERWLNEHSITPGPDGSYTSEEENALLGHVAETYFRIVSEAVRAADPNHLLLGSRMYSHNKLHVPLMEAAGRYNDVVSFNMYGNWAPSPEAVELLVKYTGRPILISEWYAKGKDSGLNNQPGAGFEVKTQKERGQFYQHFSLGSIQHPQIVGHVWFRYFDDFDQDPERSSNKGVYTSHFEPWTELLNAMKEINTITYPLIDYLDKNPLDFSFETDWAMERWKKAQRKK